MCIHTATIQTCFSFSDSFCLRSYATGTRRAHECVRRQSWYITAHDNIYFLLGFGHMMNNHYKSGNKRAFRTLRYFVWKMSKSALSSMVRPDEPVGSEWGAKEKQQQSSLLSSSSSSGKKLPSVWRSKLDMQCVCRISSRDHSTDSATVSLCLRMNYVSFSPSLIPSLTL